MKYPSWKILGKDPVIVLNRLILRWFFCRLGVGYDDKNKQLRFVVLFFPVSPFAKIDSHTQVDFKKLRVLWQNRVDKPQTELKKFPDLLTAVPVVAKRGATKEEILKCAREVASAELVWIEESLKDRTIAFEIEKRKPKEDYQGLWTKIKSRTKK